jgi:guanosine-3',5'-bis(diphosphate) 3'-pyrophosphohydrolase
MTRTKISLVAKAADFAARRHVNQRRKGVGNEPYINHLAEVAMLLAVATEGNDAELVAAGYLHDTLEDTQTEYEELAGVFGAEIAQIVAEVTDDKSLPKAVRKELQVEKVRSKSERARMLKIADKTSNLRSLAMSPPADWDSTRALEYIRWAESVVAGCRGLNPNLEKLFDAAAADARVAINTNAS